MNVPPTLLRELIDAPDFAPQQKFPVKKDSWLRWLGHIDSLAESIEDLPQQMDRLDVAQFVTANLKTDTASAFVAAMMWGHGSSGYGPYRTAYVLTGSRAFHGANISEQSVRRLEKASEIATQDGPVAGYYYLNNEGKIAGLGPAFFTKWLYFVTTENGRNVDNTAAVLDQLVMRWLRDNGGPRLRYAKTPSYEKYIDLLRQWGKSRSTGNPLPPADVEERIFRLIRNDGSRPQPDEVRTT